MNESTSFIQELNTNDLVDTKSFMFTEFDNNVLFQDNHTSHNNDTIAQQQQQQQQVQPLPSSPTLLTGVYSNTGFDMIQILSRLSHRLVVQ